MLYSINSFLCLQAQRKYPIDWRRTSYSHRLRLHVVDLASKSRLRNFAIQIDSRIRNRHGWIRFRHVRVLQNIDFERPTSGAQTHG